MIDVPSINHDLRVRPAHVRLERGSDGPGGIDNNGINDPEHYVQLLLAACSEDTHFVFLILDSRVGFQTAQLNCLDYEVLKSIKQTRDDIVTKMRAGGIPVATLIQSSGKMKHELLPAFDGNERLRERLDYYVEERFSLESPL